MPQAYPGSVARSHPIEELLAHREWIRRTARSLVAGASADDVAQNLWLEIMRRPFQPGEPRSWLRAITRNLALKERRTTRRRVNREETLGRAVMSRGGERCESAEQILERAQIERSVVELLDALDAPHRRTLLLRYFHGLSSAEIGRRLSLPPGTVRRHLKEGLDQLRDQLDTTHGGRQRWAPALLPVAAAVGEASPSAGPQPPRGRVANVPPPASPARMLLAPAALVVTTLAMVAGSAGAAFFWVASDRSRLPAARAEAPSLARPPAFTPLVAERLATAPGDQAPPAGAASAATPEPFAYWPLDGEAGSAAARDRSGHGNHCRLHGVDPASSWIPGHRGQALRLGGRGWLACERGPTRIEDEVTVAAWIRPRSAWGAQTILTLRLGQSRQNRVLVFGLMNDRLWAGSQTFMRNVDRPLPRAQPGQWQHVAFTRRGDGVLTIYANGAIIGQNPGPPVPIGDGAARLTIGGAVDGPDPRAAGDLFAGDLDDVVMFDRALTDDEVAEMARALSPPA